MGQKLVELGGIKLPNRPDAIAVATLDALIMGRFQAVGRAYWIWRAGEMVAWVITCQVGSQTLQAYGAEGPAGSVYAAEQIGQAGLRTTLERLAISRDLVAAASALAATGGAG